MRSIDEALALVLDGIAPLPVERAGLAAAAGRVAAEDAAARVDLPPFDRSAMDGFAVRAVDVAAGTPLRLVGDLAAGATDGELEEIIRDAVWRKELKHHVNDPGFVQPARTMSRIGG